MTSVERIAVTGVGMISALGDTASATFANLVAGQVKYRPPQLFDASLYRAKLAAEIDVRVGDVAPPAQGDAWSRSDALAVLALRDAVSHAGLDVNAEPLSVAVGASTGGMYEAESVLSDWAGGTPSEAAARKLLSFPLSASARRIVESFGRVERTVTVCSACSSGANAALVGAAWLRRGVAKRVAVGGTDALCLLTFAGFNSLGATDPNRCRPFDARRQGLTLGEGAAFLILEPESVARARGARVLAWFTGWAAGAEAHHITQPEPSGAIPTRLMKRALERAHLDPTGLDYVNAHGTGTPHNDAMEARALERALGPELERVWVSSSKGQLGHTLAGAGALEAAVTVLAIAEQRVPPTGGLEEPDSTMPALRHVMVRGHDAEVRAALTNSFGFGGTGVVLLFERADARDRTGNQRPRGCVITGALAWSGGGVQEGAATAALLDSPSRTQGALGAALGQLDAERSRRFDEAAAVVAWSAERLVGEAGLHPAGVGLAAGTSFGAVGRSVRFVERVLRRGPRMASPAEFPHLVPSAAAGNGAIYGGFRGPVMAVSDLPTSGEQAVGVAENFIELGLADTMIAGAVAPPDLLVSRVLGPACSTHWGAKAGEGAAWLLLEAADSALLRGAKPLAQLLSWRSDTDPKALARALPPPPLRALVLGIDAPHRLAEGLEGSSWSAVPCRSMGSTEASEPAEWHDALGSVVLATATGLVHRGDHDAVLVWTRNETQWFAAVLGRPT